MDALSDAELVKLAGELRLSMLEMLTTAGGGHFGGSLSVVEILVTLYWSVMRVDPARPDWPDRDRLILSKGHACAALCPVLARKGYFSESLLPTFNKLDSLFGMHPDMHKIPGCDMSTGSLGHGLAVGIGMALAARADKKDYRVYVVLGDGECDEGSVWEAAMMASHHKLNNLTAVVDRNKVCLDGNTEDILSLEPLSERWRSFGWHVVGADGHDFRQLRRVLQEARNTPSQPTIIIAETVKGKGISFMEGKHEYHYASLSAKELEAARAELGGGIR